MLKTVKEPTQISRCALGRLPEELRAPALRAASQPTRCVYEHCLGTAAARLKYESARISLTAKSSRAEQREAFLSYNWAKWQFVKMRRRRLLLRVSELRELLRLEQRHIERRNAIAVANYGLAGLCAGKMMERYDTEFDDALGEFHVVLLRCVELFDCGRGVVFSTYACFSMFRWFNRYIAVEYQHRTRFPTTEFAQHANSAIAESRTSNEIAIMDLEEFWDKNAPKLTPREQRVVLRRSGLLSGHNGTPATLKQVGREMGISKERTRQIEQRGLETLRKAALG